MLRDKLVDRHVHRPGEFRWRSREISRLEGLSDAVFGFAITLLIVALEVPRTSGELLETMHGFVSFGLTFAMLYALWYRQFLFFRRYGMEDHVTAILNGALLFVVLFFVFPLKFILGVLINRLLGYGKMVRLPNGTLERAIRPEHFGPMMAIYGLGLSAVFAIFALLYAHAYRKREELGLNELEIWDTRLSIESPAYGAGAGILVALQSYVVDLVDGKPYERQAVIASMVVLYAYIGGMLYVTRKRRRQRKEMVKRLTELGESTDEGPGFQS
ncbi:MAG: hypothetical protein QOF89_5674 [Acidobacteriota bacterium]|jgi:uncharacterized membrane protein|nr:hypothetical protein [Acidobacteriota bacterium]